MQPDVDDSVVLVDDFPPEDSLGDLDDLVGLLDICPYTYVYAIE